jgi:hypothetical protein
MVCMPANPNISPVKSAERLQGALILVFETVLTEFCRCQSVPPMKCSLGALDGALSKPISRVERSALTAV